ncbi:hypothetical protein chiPu_0033908, partial [Chiloscyllium punctatum]|nr:hypothetical protein [Chiloscyllium punctatum]
HHRRDQAEIAEPAGEEFLARGEHGRLPLGIEQQQLVEPEAGRDPRQRELEQIARDDQQQHRREGQTQPLGEAGLPAVAVEIVAAIQDDDQADEGDQHEHDRGQSIDVESQADTCEPHRACHQGAVDRDAEARGCGHRQGEAGDPSGAPSDLSLTRLGASGRQSGDCER